MTTVLADGNLLDARTVVDHVHHSITDSRGRLFGSSSRLGVKDQNALKSSV